MKLSLKEKTIIQFLFNYRIWCETEQKQTETVRYLKSLQGHYKEMFEGTVLFHDDDRLSKSDLKVIKNIYLNNY
jgi:hypothetical protein